MQRVGSAGTKSSQHLTKQFARFGLLAAEPDAMTFQRLVSHSGRFCKGPIESMASSRLLEIRMRNSVRTSIAESLPQIGKARVAIGRRIEQRQIGRVVDLRELVRGARRRSLAMVDSAHTPDTTRLLRGDREWPGPESRPRPWSFASTDRTRRRGRRRTFRAPTASRSRSRRAGLGGNRSSPASSAFRTGDRRKTRPGATVPLPSCRPAARRPDPAGFAAPKRADSASRSPPKRRGILPAVFGL